MFIPSLTYFLFLFLGLIILILSGDLLVKASSALAIRLGIPPLIIGMTIIAFGTSAPELFVSIKAVLSNSGELALGNIIGSNIANLSLVISVPALFAGIQLTSKGTKRFYSTVLTASLLIVFLSLDSKLTMIDGIILFISGLGFILYSSYLSFKKSETSLIPEIEATEQISKHWIISVLFIGAGIIGLPIGANLIVTNAQNIAIALEIPDSIIGLTIIAIGTSLPELAAALSAIWRKNTDLAIGNVLGSNIFNIFIVGGISAMTGQIPVPDLFFRLDYPVMLFITFFIGILIFRKIEIRKKIGLVLLFIYIIYLVFLAKLVF